MTKLEENPLQAEIMYFCFYQKNVAFIGIMIAHSSLLVIIKLYRLEVETVVIFVTENSNLSGNFFAASLHPLSPPTIYLKHLNMKIVICTPLGVPNQLSYIFEEKKCNLHISPLVSTF